MATIKVHPVGATQPLIIDSVGEIEIDGVLFTPEAITAMGQHPERVVSAKRDTKDGKTLLVFKTVRVLDDTETKVVWPDATDKPPKVKVI